MFGAVPPVVPACAAYRQRPSPSHRRAGAALLATALAAALATSTSWPSSAFAALAAPTLGRGRAAAAEAYDDAPVGRNGPEVDDVTKWFEEDARTFFVGQRVQGKVKHTTESGTTLVSLGGRKPALLGRADRAEGFPVKLGGIYDFTVKDVKPDGTVFLSSKRSSLDLKIGWEFDGYVEGFSRRGGAYIDIGCDRRGLLMASDISNDWVSSAADVLREGEKVHVWVKDLREDGKFMLTMIKIRKPLEWLRVGKAYTGIVTELATIHGRRGAFVDIGARKDGWLPSSEVKGGTNLVVNREIDVFVKDVRSRDFLLTMQEPKTPINEFRVGEKRRGRVAGYTDFGTIWVDVGGVVNGIVPIDGLKTEANMTAQEAFNVNQIITVWVKKKKDGLVLTMIRPRLDPRELQRGDAISAKVANLDPYGGVFVDIGAVCHAYMPPGSVAERLKAQPLEVGQELDVRLDNLNRHDQVFVSTLPYCAATGDFFLDE